MFARGSTMTPPVGKSGPWTKSRSFSSRGARMLHEMEAGVDQLVDVVGRDVRRHADGDAGGAVGEQVREGRRQHHGLALGAVVVVAEVDRVLGEPFEQRRGGGGHPRLGVALGGGVVAVDVAEVALAVDERIADVEVLGEAGEGVVDRLVAVRVVGAHHLADDLRALAEGAVRVEAQAAHAVEDAAVDGLQAVAGVGQRPVHDRRQRIGQVALAERPVERLGGDQPPDAAPAAPEPEPMSARCRDRRVRQP